MARNVWLILILNEVKFSKNDQWIVDIEKLGFILHQLETTSDKVIAFFLTRDLEND